MDGAGERDSNVIEHNSINKRRYKEHLYTAREVKVKIVIQIIAKEVCY